MTRPDDAPETGALQQNEPETEDETTSEKDGVDRVLDPYLRLASRVVGAARGLFAAHLMIVRSEAERELIRLLFGLVFLGGTVVCFVCTAILGSVTLVVAIQRFSGLPLLESLLLCLAVTSSLGLFSLLIAWWRLWRPIMPQSRELLDKTLSGLGARR